MIIVTSTELYNKSRLFVFNFIKKNCKTSMAALDWFCSPSSKTVLGKCGVVAWNTIIYHLTNKKKLKTYELINSRILKIRM